MPKIQKPALQSLYDKVIAQQAQVDRKTLDDIVAIVGDRQTFGFTTTSSKSIADQIAARPSMSDADKVALARRGLDAQEQQDLRALLDDDAFKSKLDQHATNFLRAVLGLDPLPTPGHVVTPAPGATSTPAEPKPAVEKPVELKADASDPAVQAAMKLKELIKSGELKNYYNAVIGAVDDPTLKAEAEKLFAALPVVKPGMSAVDFVKAGLWTKAPAGIAEMERSARYLPGRQVLVQTTCYSKVPARSDITYEQQRRKIGSYDPNGNNAVTYRATLVGEDKANPKNFIVAVDGPDGKPVEISVSRDSIYTHNQPHVLQQRYIKSDTKRELPYSGWTSWDIDFASPLAKAKLCEVALKMDEFVQKLDFTREKVEAKGATIIGRGAMAQKMVDLQKSCVEVVFRSIDMKYPREDGKPFTDPGRAPDGNRDVARQAIKGTGMCVQQSTVFGGLMAPFVDILGVDGQFRTGNCFRNINGATDNVYAPDYASGHGWWQITFRPSMEMTVTDRTWNQVNLPLDRAYGFPYGDRYAAQNIAGFSTAPIRDTDVNVSGDITVQTMERQFSQAGDGREHHISLTQDDH